MTTAEAKNVVEQIDKISTQLNSEADPAKKGGAIIISSYLLALRQEAQKVVAAAPPETAATPAKEPTAGGPGVHSSAHSQSQHAPHR